jgi:AmmeMemoRadiSam system protein B/AmmeMemoRadiSam system protein A
MANTQAPLARPPAVAGLFYPGVAHRLEEAVAGLLAEAAPPETASTDVKALIVPHAGYLYSGPVAASAYACVAALRDRVERVVLLGPAHRVPLRGLAAPRATAFRTPLGDVPVDRAAVDALADLPQVAVSDAPHAPEHSLEVQLPFLQHLLGAFSLVPLVVGDASDEDVAEVLERLWGGPETLVVISSDLSHYEDYETARRLDTATTEAIERLDADALDWDSACGRIPVRGLLVLARRRGLVARTLDLRSSGDTAGDRDRVVGYGAWAFAPKAGTAVDPRDDSATDPSTEDEAAHDERLLGLARRSIETGLATGRPAGVDGWSWPDALLAPGACFVTLRDPIGALRGCIGSLEAHRPLVDDVARNAFAAAFRDPRMEPVVEHELDALHIEISLLGAPEAIAVRSRDELLERLRPGQDGLVLEDLGRRATFLPQVWSQLPDPVAFVSAIWQKAGLPADHWSPTCRVWRYGVRSIEERRA